MPRRRRSDAPGVFHHVYNRAIARRPMFESREDIRFFLSLVARAVRRREIRVVAYSVLTTHYHLFVESRGRLAEAMRRIQSSYSRYFNRRRRRDGALARGRFASKRVDSDRYRLVLVSYIDRNPVDAKIVGDAASYEYGSARHYSNIRAPRWLDRRWLSRVVRAATGRELGEGRAYEIAFNGAYRDLDEVVERRMTFADEEDDPLDNLVSAAPERVLAWMQRKARLADGTRAGLPVAPRRLIRDAVERHAEAIPPVAVALGAPLQAVRDAVLSGMLRTLAGSRIREIALEGIPQGAIARHLTFHQWALLSNGEYGLLCARLARFVLDALPRLLRTALSVSVS